MPLPRFHILDPLGSALPRKVDSKALRCRHAQNAGTSCANCRPVRGMSHLPSPQGPAQPGGKAAGSPGAGTGGRYHKQREAFEVAARRGAARHEHDRRRGGPGPGGACLHCGGLPLPGALGVVDGACPHPAPCRGRAAAGAPERAEPGIPVPGGSGDPPSGSWAGSLPSWPGSWRRRLGACRGCGRTGEGRAQLRRLPAAR